MELTGRPKATFFPRADAAVLISQHDPTPARPTTVAPIFDQENYEKPIEAWSTHVESRIYPLPREPYGASAIPEPPSCPTSRYPRARLAKNERLRLSMLWYYTRDILNEPELLAGLHQKALMAKETAGWEFAVIGVLDVNVYIRLATVGLQLAILPRGETLCAHTVTQPPGSVFLLPDMMEDWRFRDSPYVELGGLTAYAGVPLRMQNESGEAVGLGSLCVVSRTREDPLTKSQQQALARLGDWVVADIVQCTRTKRQRERRRLADLIAEVHDEADEGETDESILRIMRIAYPDAAVTLQSSRAGLIQVEGSTISLSDFEHGLWEDVAYIDDFIESSNHLNPPTDKVIRLLGNGCESLLGPSFLAVATKDFKHVFDDVDHWFVGACADMISQRWQKHLLADAVRAKDKFLRGISHQLRTPIHGILGAADLLAEDLMVDAQQGAHSERTLTEGVTPAKPFTYLDTITASGKTLMSIVNSMITLMKWADVATIDRQYATHSIHDLETELVSGLAESTPQGSRQSTSIFFKHELPQGCDSLRVDLNHLTASILPLVTNAIQHTPMGVVSVMVSMGQDCEELVVDVQDNGCGIHSDDQRRIFELYEKVDIHSTRAGLGLSLATKFATLLHGSVELVSSTVKRGSHFRAIFRDVDLVQPLSRQPMVGNLSGVPSKFHTMAGSDLALCQHFSDFLIRNGFTASESMNDSIVILDLATDPEQHKMQIEAIPPRQVALCLVPALGARAYSESPPNNVVYVESPFLTSTMSAALDRADALLAIVNQSQHMPRFDRQLFTPAARENPASDEGYMSLSDGSPSATDLEAPSSAADAPDLELVVRQKDEFERPASMELKADDFTFAALASVAKPRALLVDDNAINLRILEMYCRKRGLPYCCASNGQQAVDIFSQQQLLAASETETPIQVILMDLQMPVCDGIEATRQIRSLESQHKWAESHLFIITGQDGPSDREAADKAGANEYLVKPVSIGHLDRVLMRCFPAFETSWSSV